MIKVNDRTVANRRIDVIAGIRRPHLLQIVRIGRVITSRTQKGRHRTARTGSIGNDAFRIAWHLLVEQPQVTNSRLQV